MQTAFAIELPLAALVQPVPAADPNVGELRERHVAPRAVEQGGCITARARQALMQLISNGNPSRDRVAATLCMSERTLQRRLTDEGTRFGELVDDTRRELAQHYLEDSALTPTQMSFALGFSDPSNFYRACKRWFGRIPDSLRCPARCRCAGASAAIRQRTPGDVRRAHIDARAGSILARPIPPDHGAKCEAHAVQQPGGLRQVGIEHQRHAEPARARVPHHLAVAPGSQPDQAENDATEYPPRSRELETGLLGRLQSV